jgi:esterase/lipase superfamily enzyme
MLALIRGFGLNIFGLMLLVTGCSGPRLMMPTPNVHLDESRDYYSNLAPELMSTEVRLLYVTDRAPERDEDGKLRYGFGRSNSLAFGSVVVDLGVDITWEELKEASRTQSRLESVKLEMGKVEEIVRGPPVPLPFTNIDGEIVEEPRMVTKRTEAKEAFRRALVRQLELTPRKEVFIYVHGYHNTFNDAAFAMAELWHFMGRIGVPFIYTWPAGYPGLFGYTYDRESSEFTVFHLRQVLRLIASYPEVEKVHLIAHSRGTDVAVNALRELTIGARAAGLDPRREFKIYNLVLAAPDLDVQVAEQRLIGDQLAQSVERFTIYTSPADEAIGLASTLFSSPRGRIGRYALEHVNDLTRSAMEYGNANFAVIDFSGAGDSQGDSYGHSYFRNAPTVSSDLVLMLRDDIDAGTPGRPLANVGLKFWRIPPGYPPRN